MLMGRPQEPSCGKGAGGHGKQGRGEAGWFGSNAEQTSHPHPSPSSSPRPYWGRAGRRAAGDKAAGVALRLGRHMRTHAVRHAPRRCAAGVVQPKSQGLQGGREWWRVDVSWERSPSQVSQALPAAVAAAAHHVLGASPQHVAVCRARRGGVRAEQAGGRKLTSSSRHRLASLRLCPPPLSPCLAHSSSASPGRR